MANGPSLTGESLPSPASATWAPAPTTPQPGLDPSCPPSDLLPPFLSSYLLFDQAGVHPITPLY